MKRTISVLTLTLVAYGAALAEPPHPEATIYVNGNLTGVSPNTGGTLMFSDEKAMYLRTNSANIAVPYASISHAEIGVPGEHSHQIPLYKVWLSHKRIPTRYLTLAFKSGDADARNMTLELTQSAASNVMSTLQSHTRPGVVPADSVPQENKNAPWWGDDYWKTDSNTDKWDKAMPTSAGSSQ